MLVLLLFRERQAAGRRRPGRLTDGTAASLAGANRPLIRAPLRQVAYLPERAMAPEGSREWASSIHNGSSGTYLPVKEKQ
ncbi:hypothetical protein EV141_1038 [Microcella putealis]|uniref:Uncharacterized protein n=1 Tax=Microcella putealis TaxID=337005 RepID=A0A4Q7LTF3_9MICO|nr:hypothetical protein EV141_1038 [Microcella putealis]TQM19529.1 hypothetical protein BJ957_2352 [Microcella putealis]